MTDPRTQLITFPLTLGMDNVSHPELVQPVGARPRHVRSMNTRLTKLPGCVSKAPEVTALPATLNSTQGGVIPAGLADTTLVPDAIIDPPKMRRVVGAAVGNVSHHASAGDPQSMYYPAQVERAGVLSGANMTVFSPSAAYQASTGWTYYVTIRRFEVWSGVFLNVIADDGREIINSLLVVAFLTVSSFDDERAFAAITVHGATVVLWTAAATDVDLVARILTVNPTTLAVSLGPTAVIHTVTGSFSGPAKVQLSYDDLDPLNAYLIAPNQGDFQKFDVKRITIPALTIAATFTSAAVGVAGISYLAISYRAGIGLLAAAAVPGAKINEYELNPTGLAQIWTQPAQLEDGQPSCGFETQGGLQRRVFAVSRTAAGQRGTLVEWRDAAGALLLGGIIKHQTMVGQIVSMRSAHNPSEMCCLFTTQVCYRPNQPLLSYDPTDSPTIGVNFVPDPSIEVFRVTRQLASGFPTLLASCVARLGTDLAVRYPGALNPLDPFAGPNRLFIQAPLSCLSVGPGGRILVTYLQENTIEGNVAMGYSVRYALLSFLPTQPRFAHTGEGATIVAGALPAVWDGASLTEFSPLRQTSIGHDVTGTGPAFPAGTYLFAAIITWVDAQGQLHRSAPSNVDAAALTGTQSPTVYVRLPDSYRNAASQPGFQVVLYVSEMNGVVLYANPAWLTAIATTAFDADYAVLNNIPLPVVDAFHPAIYTDNSATQPLAAYCPNACLDVAVIADRAWMLDAERPGRWWFSKPKEPGVFFEMSPDLYVDTPSNAGRGVALSEWQGNPVFLTSKGIWTTAGEGPDALAQPPFFAAAAQVSDVACTQRLSVVKTPVGVMFVSDNRFVRFAGQMVTYPEIDALLYGAVVGVAVFRKQQECCWFTSQGYVYVYNWTADAFTLWDQTVTGMTTMTGAAQRSDGKVIMVNNTQLRLMDPDAASTTAQIEIVTGFASLGDKQDNNNLENMLLHAKRGGVHGVVLTVLSDYGSAPLDTKVRTALQVLDSTNAVGVYDVVLEPAEQAARAVQVTLTETGATGEAFQPISLTFEVIKKPGKAWRNVPESARV